MFDRGHFAPKLDHSAEGILPGERLYNQLLCLLHANLLVFSVKVRCQPAMHFEVWQRKYASRYSRFIGNLSRPTLSAGSIYMDVTPFVRRNSMWGSSSKIRSFYIVAFTLVLIDNNNRV